MLLYAISIYRIYELLL